MSATSNIESRQVPRDSPLLGSLSLWLLRLVDAGLAGVIFIAPLFMGGRHPFGRLVFIALACLVAVAWFWRQALQKRAAWTWSGAEWLLLAGLAVVALQLVPLPDSLLTQLSPTIHELLPLWTAEADPATSCGIWKTVSLAPVETRGGLVTYLAYAMLFVVAVQRIRSIEDVERLLRWIALAAIGMATLGMLQFLLGNGKFLWVYEHPSRTTYNVVKGTFANQNHFAHFLALGLGPLIWWLHRLRPASDAPSRSSREKAGFAGRGTARHPTPDTRRHGPQGNVLLDPGRCDKCWRSVWASSPSPGY